MKTTLYLMLMSALLIGCAKTKGIVFCEGISPAGDGVNCGKKFEDGELTALIASDNPFGVKTISVRIYEIKNNKTEQIEAIPVEVKPEARAATVNLAFYAGGKYVVRAMTGNVLIGENQLEIVER
ncbi:MAG: hypothetical protein A2W19_02805 [Spirochaetes bacterium RBG_16_49_21]|nr:MAG: hypothetical protein A2W19_02805 [Spirochaetes bacterium RBG_16_49_21]